MSHFGNTTDKQMSCPEVCYKTEFWTPPPLNEVPADLFVKASVYLRDVCVYIYIYMYFDIGVVSFIFIDYCF